MNRRNHNEGGDCAAYVILLVIATIASWIIKTATQ